MTTRTATAHIEDVVRVSGYSRSTVFRYLSGKEVRSPARIAIRAAMASLGYRPERLSVSDTIGIVISVSPVFDRFRGYAEIIEGIMARAAESGTPVLLDRNPHSDKTGYGVIIVGKNIRDEESESEALKRKNVAHVLVNRTIDDPEISFVSVDFKAAACELVSHLIAQGHRRIGVWVDPVTTRVARDKFAGFLAAFEAAGLEADASCITGPGDGDLTDVLGDLLSRPEDGPILTSSAALGQAEGDTTNGVGGDKIPGRRPTAWFALDDESALRVIRFAREKGLRVPRDLAVVGMNDIESAELVEPALTSVHIPFREAGIAAVDAVRRLVEHKGEKSVKILLKHALVIRDSSLSGW